MQAWLSRRGASPYSLYAASNAGSLLALVAYPTLIEPTIGLRLQLTIWTTAFFLLIPLLWLTGKPRPQVEPTEAPAPPTTWKTRLLWLALALVPSSLLQGVTTYLTTDIASLPLLWVIPLGIYLLSFVVAFSERNRLDSKRLDALFVAGLVSLVLLLAMEAVKPAWLLFLLHLGFFSIACLYFSLRLAESRPSSSRLTEFYLWIAIGGAAGGLFNALIAPKLFNHVLEYPLAILVAGLLRRRTAAGTFQQRFYDMAVPILILVASVFVAIVARIFRGETEFPVAAIGLGILAAVCLYQKARPIRFGFGLAAILIGASVADPTSGKILRRERNFFGVLRVTQDSSGPFHRLYHGTTIHGIQATDSAHRCEPLSYYYRGGSFDRLWRLSNSIRPVTNVAAVGLGAGSVLAESKADQNWSIYEIDPAVIRLASDGRWFTFLKCAPAQTRFTLGDARVRLQEARPASFDLMILDAFNSDSVPMHLLTREAVRVYRSKLAPGGMILAHVSSRNLNLEPVLVNVAAKEGFAAFKPAQVASPNQHSTLDAVWVLLVDARNLPPEFVHSENWIRVEPNSGYPTWTDDFCSLWRVIQLK